MNKIFTKICRICTKEIFTILGKIPICNSCTENEKSAKEFWDSIQGRDRDYEPVCELN